MQKYFIWFMLTFIASTSYSQTSIYRSKLKRPAIKCLFPSSAETLNNMMSLKRESLSNAIDRPITQASYITPEGHFKIHYDTTGTHAVQLTYDLGKSVPDWIYYSGLAYERGWNLLIDSLLYQIPPVDTVDGNEVDIYLKELSNLFIYGQTISDFMEDTINVSYIEMDNDFSEGIYFSNGLDGMRVTAMHLLFHVIQLGYTFRFSDAWFFELASTWFEDVGYDEVNDYVQYIESFYNLENRSLYRTNGYQAAIFGKFLEENYDAFVITEAWENMPSMSAETSLDQALKANVAYEPEHGISAAYGKFALWNWYTGNRHIPNLFFADGALYPEIIPESDSTVSDVTTVSPGGNDII